jgi:hypothetical protein
MDAQQTYPHAPHILDARKAGPKPDRSAASARRERRAADAVVWAYASSLSKQAHPDATRLSRAASSAPTTPLTDPRSPVKRRLPRLHAVGSFRVRRPVSRHKSGSGVVLCWHELTRELGAWRDDRYFGARSDA